MTRPLRATDLGPLAVGLLALAAGTAFGWDARLLEAIVTPPNLMRAVLVAVAVVAGAALLLAAFRRLAVDVAAPGGTPAEGAARIGERDLTRMVRGIRLVFLAVAAFAAAAGWLLGHPLPIVVALIIAGVDVIETSFLLLVVAVRNR